MKKIITLCVVVAFFALSIVFINASATTNEENKETETANVTPISTNESFTNSDDAIDNEQTKSIHLKHKKINSKKDLYSKVLNSIDYYNEVSGEIKTNMLNKKDETIKYNVNMEESKAYQYVTGENFDEEVYVTDDNIFTFDNLSRTYTVDAAVSKSEENNEELGKLNPSDRIKYTTAGGEKIYEKDEASTAEGALIPIYYYRDDPTNIHYSSTVSLFPQEMAFGFLSNESLWNITQQTDLLGRKCTVVEGETDKDYGQKLNIQRFEMIIDDESGIILNFKGYDENENLTNYISTKQISFSCRGIKKLDINNYKEYNLNNQIDTGNSYEDNP